jgi:ABC-2 type transport system permease protein
MNRYVFLNTFKNSRIGLLWYFVAAFIGVAAGGAGLSTIQGESGAALTDVIKQLPPALLAAFKIDVSSFLSPIGFITSRSLGLFIPLILIAFAAGSAGSISQLVERGTIHFELSLPIARWRWLLSRILVAVSSLFCIITIITMTLYVFTPAEWWRYGIYGFAFALLWLGIAYAIAAFARDRSVVTTLVFGFFGVQYLISILASVSQNSQWLTNLSIWSAYAPEAVMTQGVPWLTVLIWFATAILGFTVALYQWQQRDIPA